MPSLRFINPDLQARFVQNLHSAGFGVTLDAAGNLAGMLDAGVTGAMACTGTLAADGTLTVICGACTLTLARSL